MFWGGHTQGISTKARQAATRITAIGTSDYHYTSHHSATTLSTLAPHGQHHFMIMRTRPYRVPSFLLTHRTMIPEPHSIQDMTPNHMDYLLRPIHLRFISLDPLFGSPGGCTHAPLVRHITGYPVKVRTSKLRTSGISWSPAVTHFGQQKIHLARPVIQV